MASTLFREELIALRKQGMFRSLRVLRGEPGPFIKVGARQALLLCSNNYLGLAHDERVKNAACQAVHRYGTGSTGSRLISGNIEPHIELEQELASFKGTEAALVFASGYHANIGTIPALVGPGDVIFSDALNHASLIDGARLSRAEIRIYRHADAADLTDQLQRQTSARRKLIITESIFSMDGDQAPLTEIAKIARAHGAMTMVDEAHGTGVFGPSGAGLVEELGLSRDVDVQMGTFSKALGSHGGYVAGSQGLIEILVNRARSFIFTTGLPPAVLAASAEAIRIIRSEPQHRVQLWRNVGLLREGLIDLGFTTGPTKSQIIPVIIGDERRTMSACRFLLQQGVFVQGIRPPTVPSGTARLRLAPMATHTEAQLQKALRAFEKMAQLMNAPKRRRSGP
ncbi:MAG: 8-amino-7-oxononanoate synthase [Acidobacteria bacterium]|nr:8-amino-7-oxononanoate synthase [Acidobacteriota bacterium]